ncbi:MAG: hypothetical protein OXC08_18870 [Thiotrichales bacterium]|nr:hypothetical protein [Thiotrichales bacterium]
MDAKEVHDLLTQRMDRHDGKCDERQSRIYSKFDAQEERIRSLERLVYIGFGIVITLELGLGAIVTGALEKLF